MKTGPVTPQALTASVIAVPPLARRDDLTLNRDENRKLIRHLEAGGITCLLYGGNANFYNIAPSEYAGTLAWLAEAAGPRTWVVPSVGPDYGKMMDQAAILKDTEFPTAMVLPLGFPTTPEGVERGLAHFAERFGRPIVLYLKSEAYLGPAGVRRLVERGLVCAVKYAIVRDDPREDAYLRQLLDEVDARYVVSGIGERPALVHMRDFGLPGFTSGSVCVAPNLSTRMLLAMKAGHWQAAAQIRERFLPLEDLRDGLGPTCVLHDAVALAGIAETGPMLPLVSNLSVDQAAVVRDAARALLAQDRETALAAPPVAARG